jgi:hypothetical protein
MLGGIRALPHVRKQGSPQSNGGAEQKSQVSNWIFFSVSVCLCGDSLLQMVIKDTDSPERMVYQSAVPAVAERSSTMVSPKPEMDTGWRKD